MRGQFTMNQTLQTKRLILRPFSRSDRALVYAIASDPETTRYLYYWGRLGMTVEADTERFLRYAAGGWEKQPIIDREYVLQRKEDGVDIGDGSIQLLSGDEAEIGWILLPQYRGHGYVTEMAQELLRFGFEELKVGHIVASCDARNTASFRVMERLGMRHEETRLGVRPEKREGEKKGDTLVYGLTRDSWLQKKTPAGGRI